MKVHAGCNTSKKNGINSRRLKVEGILLGPGRRTLENNRAKIATANFDQWVPKQSPWSSHLDNRSADTFMNTKMMSWILGPRRSRSDLTAHMEFKQFRNPSLESWPVEAPLQLVWQPTTHMTPCSADARYSLKDSASSSPKAAPSVRVWMGPKHGLTTRQTKVTQNGHDRWSRNAFAITDNPVSLFGSHPLFFPTCTLRMVMNAFHDCWLLSCTPRQYIDGLSIFVYMFVVSAVFSCIPVFVHLHSCPHGGASLCWVWCARFNWHVFVCVSWLCSQTCWKCMHFPIDLTSLRFRISMRIYNACALSYED